MARFDDYHRTVVGYHGTGLSAALRIVNRVEGFRKSERDYDWLGRGIYFWEYAPQQALDFARIRQRQLKSKKNKTPDDVRRESEPLAVLACMIRLGYCLDLTEPNNVKYLADVFSAYQESIAIAGAEVPKNTRKYRRLDCAVFEYAYKLGEASEPSYTVDTARGIYVPTDGATRVWAGSWISKGTHIQICVRNPASILGTWLHSPTGLGVNDVREALQTTGFNVGIQNPQSESEVEENDDGAEDRTDG